MSTEHRLKYSCDITGVSGLHFWARGYCVSTVGLDEETIRNYIREQEKSEQQQMELEFDDV
jgi:putative transposase